MLKKIFYISVLGLALTVINCGSAEVKSLGEEEIVKQLNKQLEAYDISGYAGDQTAVPEAEYKKWAETGLPFIMKTVLPAVPARYKLHVVGNADSAGGPAKAAAIAKGRADAFKARLVKDGVDGSKLGVKSAGDAKFASKSSGRTANRRVDFEVIIAQ